MPKLQDVAIVVSKDGRTVSRTVRATILGPLAVHASIDAGPCSTRAYTITHRATGKRVAALPQKRFALECARLLLAAVAWPDNGKLPRVDRDTAGRIIREVADRSWFYNIGM